ncbi:electron transport complex subunit RsxB [Basilea psittacipulmonis]|uniref:Ferredoxin n=1 Tax=Basilea psittacipulmonis DSM 24701 TaxID=1072685 RepID=A0A077DBC2_9BURK|nr:electron transport complex subunit RsxB [Basilea psittacipulmonis]AIL32155.1 ferredoxin [Basilea psittacipulmonis DSM 24701]
MSLTEKINAILPQTQCTKCGYEGCLPYAQAMAEHEAQINRCVPGGTKTIEALSHLLNQPVLPLDPTCGVEKPLEVAYIDENHCIGCTLCIQACPVDAIIGVNKYMHTVIPDLCSGCELCVAPCPVDCISMKPASREWTFLDAQEAKQRYEQRQQRLQMQEDVKEEVSVQQTSDVLKQDLIAKALAKARARRAK